MDPAIRKILYQASLDSPGAWLMQSFWLKKAAEEIDVFAHRDAEERGFGFMSPVFNLLMGLSFENLLKGIVSVQRGTSGSSGTPDKDLTTHEMEKLVRLIDQTAIPISAEDLAILLNLEKYVVWAGRYPFPKREDEHEIALVHSYDEYRRMISLWNRLHKHLKSVGWVMRGSNKLWTDKLKNGTDAEQGAPADSGRNCGS